MEFQVCTAYGMHYIVIIFQAWEKLVDSEKTILIKASWLPSLSDSEGCALPTVVNPSRTGPKESKPLM